MQKKVLGILGSPCPEGNAAALLDAVLRGAESSGAQTERIDVASLDIRPCDSCRECDTLGACSHFKDDMGIIYSKIREVDVIVLASPIYFMGVSAQLKAMIDRCQCFWIERYVLKNRPYKGRAHPKGFFIATAGSSRRPSSNLRSTAQKPSSLLLTTIMRARSSWAIRTIPRFRGRGRALSGAPISKARSSVNRT